MIVPAVRTRRARALGLVIAVAMALSATACNPGRPPAASVGGIDISAQRVDDLVAAFATADPAFREGISGAGEGTYLTSWAVDALRILVTRVATAGLSKERRSIVDSTHRNAAEDELARSLLPDDPDKGAAVVDALADGTREWLVELVAAGLALQADLGTDGPADPELVRRYYEQNTARFTQVCIRLLVVGAEDVDAALDRLEAGEDFGDLSEELSVDPAVAEARGGSDCPLLSALQQQLQAEAFQEIASAAVEGGLAGPFVYDQEGNVVVVEVSPHEPVPFDEIAEQLATDLPADARLEALVLDELSSTEVRIDPRFGRWDRASRTVVAPAGPGR